MTNSRVERSHLPHYATVWDFVGLGLDGAPYVSDEPREIRCRWVSSRRETIGADNNPLAYDDSITLLDEVTERSLMRLGKIADLPAEPDSLFEVLTTSYTPDIKNRAALRTLTLGRFTGPLPLGV